MSRSATGLLPDHSAAVSRWVPKQPPAPRPGSSGEQGTDEAGLAGGADICLTPVVAVPSSGNDPSSTNSQEQ